MDNDIIVDAHNKDSIQKTLLHYIFDHIVEFFSEPRLIKIVQYFDIPYQQILLTLQRTLLESNEQEALVNTLNKLSPELCDLATEILDEFSGLYSKEAFLKLLKAFVDYKKLKKLTEEINELISKSTSTSVILQKVNELVFTLSRDELSETTIKPISEEWESFVDKIKEMLKGDYNGFCFPTLETVIPYFMGGELVVIAGRPSVGKTTVMWNLALEYATLKNEPVGFISLEMSSEQLLQRHIQRYLKKNLREIIQTKEEESFDYLIANYQKQILQETQNIYVTATPYSSLSEIVSLINFLVLKGVKVFFIDYLQLIKAPQKASRYLEIAQITHSLKLLALQHNILIFVGSQLNRSIEQREDKRPRLSDLRESGDIEQDADVVIFLRKEIDNEAEEENIPYENFGLTYLYFDIAKNRHGIVGEIRKVFDTYKLVWDNE